MAIEAPAPEQLDERTEILVERIARLPVNQLSMMKLLVNQSLYSQGLHATQLIGTVFDGITRHTAEGYAFQQRAAEAGFRQAVRERDEPFGDSGRRPSRADGRRRHADVATPGARRRLFPVHTRAAATRRAGAGRGRRLRGGVGARRRRTRRCRRGNAIPPLAVEGELSHELFAHLRPRGRGDGGRSRSHVRAPRRRGVEAALVTFAERALRNPRLAWALIAEPVDRSSTSSAWPTGASTRAASSTACAPGSLPVRSQRGRRLTAATLVGASARRSSARCRRWPAAGSVEQILAAFGCSCGARSGGGSERAVVRRSNSTGDPRPAARPAARAACSGGGA